MNPKAEISFHAESVEIIDNEFTPDFTVIGFHFGQGDPEKGGQHWNFTQSIPPEDGIFDGVCTVKEIQQVTVYGGIRRFELWSDHLVCEFDERTSPKTGTEKLCISYAIPTEQWEKLAAMAGRVFEGRSCFEVRSSNGP
jgi:hypothetical protein